MGGYKIVTLSIIKNMATEKDSAVIVTLMQYLKSNTTNEFAFWLYGWRIVTDNWIGNCGPLKFAVFFCKLRIQKIDH